MSPLLNVKKDLYSKLIDGIFTGLLLLLIVLLISLINPVIRILFGRPGLMVYTIILLALAVALLERSLSSRYTLESRARLGLVGGLLTWCVIELSNLIGNQVVTSETSVIVFMLLILITAIIWRPYLPSGLRFYTMVILSSWGIQLLVYGSKFITNENLLDSNAFGTMGVIALILAAASVLWIFLFSKTSTQRLWAALVFFQWLVIAVYVFRGGLILF